MRPDRGAPTRAMEVMPGHPHAHVPATGPDSPTRNGVARVPSVPRVLSAPRTAWGPHTAGTRHTPPLAGGLLRCWCHAARSLANRGGVPPARDDPGAHQELTAGGTLFRMRVAPLGTHGLPVQGRWGLHRRWPERCGSGPTSQGGHEGRVHTTAPPACGDPARAAATAGESQRPATSSAAGGARRARER